MNEQDVTYPGFAVVRRLGSGAFGSTFLIRNIGAENRLHVLKLANPDAPESLKPESRVFNAMGKPRTPPPT